jgi:hypothetical protein
MIRSFVQRRVWWLFDRTPERFQDWAEAWARTLIVHRSPEYQRQLQEYSNELAYEQVQIAEQGTAIAHETWPDW